jgi:hypothetical protein
MRKQEEMEKSATSLTKLWSALSAATGAGQWLASNTLQTLGLLGTAGGAALGGGTWALGRSLTAEDQKNREMEIQRDTYRRLTSEVNDELKRRKLAPTPANTAAAVDYLT